MKISDKIVIYNPYNNHTVTDFYIKFIENSLNLIGLSTIKKNTMQKKDKCGIVVVAVEDAIKAKLLGYKPIILWVQGVAPEESFLKHKNIVKKVCLSFIELFGLKCSDFLILVSNAMLNHYKNKYHIKNKRFYIAPCFNDEINEDNFFVTDKYKNNKFVYAGGMQAWHCFEATIQIFKLIQDRVPNAQLLVLTKECNKAEGIILRHKIRNYSVSFVEPSKINDVLKSCKFGFSIREDNIVNNVSTPTKLSTYIANGVCPIYSSSIFDFSTIANNSDYCFSLNLTNTNVDKIVDACLRSFEADIVLNDFKTNFGKYYSKDNHEKMLSFELKKLLSNLN